MDLRSQMNAHKFFSQTLFDLVMTLMKKDNRDPGDIEDMVHFAHSCFFHTKNTPQAKPEKISSAYWLLSRVHVLAMDPENSLYYGRKALDIAIDRELDPYYVAYGYEALERACCIMGEDEEMYKYLEKCKNESEKITNGVTRDLLLFDLITIEYSCDDAKEEHEDNDDSSI